MGNNKYIRYFEITIVIFSWDIMVPTNFSKEIVLKSLSINVFGVQG